MRGESAALAYLSRDTLLHIDMIEPIRRGTADLLFAGADGVLLRETASGAYMMTAETPAAAAAMLALPTGEVSLLAVHQPRDADAAARRFGLNRRMVCHQTMWPRPDAPAIPPSPLTVRPLTHADAETVHAMYEHDVGHDYIRARIAAGEMLGAFEADTLAGFAGLHAEGAMGMLHIAPAYRGRGIAKHLTATLAGRLIPHGRVPFAQFVQGNEASRRLNERMGFVITPKPSVIWLER